MYLTYPHAEGITVTDSQGFSPYSMDRGGRLAAGGYVIFCLYCTIRRTPCKGEKIRRPWRSAEGTRPENPEGLNNIHKVFHKYMRIAGRSVHFSPRVFRFIRLVPAPSACIPSGGRPGIDRPSHRAGGFLLPQVPPSGGFCAASGRPLRSKNRPLRKSRLHYQLFLFTMVNI